MMSMQDMVILGTGCVLLFFWLILFLYSGKYSKMFEALEEKEFPLCELYCTGYAFWQLTRKTYKNRRDRKLRQQIEILYGKKYTEFYLRVIYAQKMTFAMFLTVLAFACYGMTQDLSIMAMILMFAGGSYYYFGSNIDQKIEKRSKAMMGDFADALSELALLTNAGMVLREAWETVAVNGDRTLYLEMRKSLEDMENGVSEMEAIRRFGNRCVVPEIRKFSGTVIQGLEKGSGDLSVMLKEQSREVWEARKQDVRRQGEKAASKLIAPMAVMFIGVLVMVIVPVFANIGM